MEQEFHENEFEFESSIPLIYIYIILYIIKIGFRRCGCAKWRHQIAEIFLNF